MPNMPLLEYSSQNAKEAARLIANGTPLPMDLELKLHAEGMDVERFTDIIETYGHHLKGDNRKPLYH